MLQRLILKLMNVLACAPTGLFTFIIFKNLRDEYFPELLAYKSNEYLRSIDGYYLYGCTELIQNFSGYHLTVFAMVFS